MAQTTMRYAYLDGLRGLAALFVVMRHTTDFWDFFVFRTYLAVDIFFILSGFVIANAYGRKMAEGTLSFGGFVLVRLIRLYPVYVLSLCLAIPLYLHEVAQTGDPLSSPQLLSLVALSAFILPAGVTTSSLLFPINGPYWSLFFELLANFTYALIRPLLSTPVLTGLVVTLGGLMAAMAVYHGSLDFGFIFEAKAIFAGFVRASFGIFFGILLHRWLMHRTISPRPWLALAIVCAVFLIPSVKPVDYLPDLLAIFVLFPACVALAATPTADRWSRGLLFLGSASYPVYVLHEPVGKAILLATDGAAATLAPLSGWLLLAGLVPLAALLESRVDEPVRRWLTRRLMGSRKPQPTPNQPRA